MANKVLVQGVGLIQEWFIQHTSNPTSSTEVIRVLHRGRDNVLSINSLSVGNLISLRGNVVGYQSENNVWEINATSPIPSVFVLQRHNVGSELCCTKTSAHNVPKPDACPIHS
ncbi:uncharacterized protein MELLADRAFT_106671 [Melampsora larici-populina 98AG31]|uniref:Uncharacterized protein n=1 Tax=Melampsora larici-populina (strain 98AG31 / pathotype 3-4-7) TaxID=747676 RepID=F4RM93_MELLP|nr:uncharacterized protein MELLADRAFT_106671 [Melampsora larici-populina 98AG31]EGG06381.1 hypothetical protein MELLADRAFT_106671 [Melampsora larici-populina 98AG31]